MRALIVTRLSRQVEESTSAERQREYCQEYCDKRGWEVIGVAEDLNVSAGSTTPFNRPELGKWLGDGKDNPGRMPEIDVIVFWRLDRLVRSMMQLSEVMRWCEVHGVELASVSDQFLNADSEYSDLIAMIVSRFAEMELNSIRERITADQHHRIRAGNFRGSLPPWGYAVTEDPERGKILVVDPEQSKTIHTVAGWLLDGWTLPEVARELDRRGIPTPRDLNHIRQGRKPKGYKWAGSRIRSMITNPAILGYIEVRDPVLETRGKNKGKPKKDHQGKTIYGDAYLVRNADGSPKQRAEPALNPDLYYKLKKELKSRENTKPDSRSNSLLLNVIYCGCCGKVAYKMAQGKGRRLRYRCSVAQSYGGKCSNTVATIDLEEADELVSRAVLGLLGGAKKREKVWHAGQDLTGEIEETKADLEGLTNLLFSGPAYRPGTETFDLVSQRIETLQKRLDKLRSTPQDPSGWKWVETDELFTDWWESATTEERNRFLVSSGVRLDYFNREDRRIGDFPDVKLSLGDLEQIHELYGGKDTKLDRIVDALGKLPPNTGIEIKDGTVSMIRGKTLDEYLAE